MANPLVILVCALPAESKPLIRMLNLKRAQNQRYFPVYLNAEKSIVLIESGIGKIKSAVATTYSLTLQQEHQHAFLCNIGIAGADQPLNSLWQINKVTDIATNKNYYPFIYHHLQSISLTTLDTTSEEYQENTLYDMEGAGFISSAQEFVSSEQVSLLKIISDNPQNSMIKISKKEVEQQIASHQTQILQHIETLLNISGNLNNSNNNMDAAFGLLSKQVHFSQYQQHQLKKVLKRWFIIHPEKNPVDLLEDFNAASKILSTLNQKLNNTPLELS
jgi:adenosylhomocysteine nucleosidase